MANLNRVLLIGRLTRDPELRYMPSGTAIAEFGMAVNRFRKAQDGSRQEETTFVDVTGFGRTAELANQYLKKGRQVFVEGHLRFEQWTSKEGQKRSKLTVVIDNMQFLDGGKGEGADGGGSDYQHGGSFPQGGGSRGYRGAPSGGGDDDFGQGSSGGGYDEPPPSGEDIPF